MTTTALLFIQIFILILLRGLSAYECLNDSNEFYCQLGTTTPYRFIANYDDTYLKYPGCKERKIWLIIRHGTRFPGKKHVKSMINKLPELQKQIIESFKVNKSELSADLIEDFSNWKLSFDDSHTMLLAEEGENELTDLAERMQERFPMLFPEDYSEDSYKFKYTATQRTERSAKAFVNGLFGQYCSENVSFPEPEHKDPILRFYKNCPRWLEEVDNNPETYKEKNLFAQSQIFQNILSEISRRVGFEVNKSDIKLIYKICAFETSWDGKTKSPWCDILSFEDIEVLAFKEDLEYYWADGYGFRLNYDQACAALCDMFTFFDECNDKSLATTYFTHSGTILKMISILGIAKDENPLTHKSFSLHKDARKWRVSLIDAFASNIAFVLYDCKDQGPSVLILHQERVVDIPGCPVGKLCPLSTMKTLFPHTEEKCQFDAMCSIDMN